MTEIRINGIEGLAEGARRFIEAMHPGRVYAFHGTMGAGKTTLISEVCRQLGAEDEASSPTFSIVNEYDTEKGGKIYHFDCYRLESAAEAMDIGAEDYFDSGCTCFVEWPENIAEILPEDTVEVKIEVLPDDSRTVTLSI